MTEPLYRLAYRSDCFLLGSDEAVRADLDEILGCARGSNAENDVTGCLALANSVFVQVLEGPMAALESTFERICCDLRHSNLMLLELAVIEDRAFPGWAMAEVTPGPETAALLSLLTAHEQSTSSVEQAEAMVRLMAAMLAADSAAGAQALGSARAAVAA